MPNKSFLCVSNCIGNLPKLRSGLSKSPDSIDAWKKVFSGLEKEPWMQDLEHKNNKLYKAIKKTLGKTIWNAWKARKNLEHAMESMESYESLGKAQWKS